MAKLDRRFHGIGFEDFRRLARDPKLSPYEKIGFPDEYRAGKEEAIFAEVTARLPALLSRGKTVVDIGPGCSGLPRLLIALCNRNGHRLCLVDSAEMLELLPPEPSLDTVPGKFPDVRPPADRYAGRTDVVLVYSVLQYVFSEGNLFAFLDEATALLAEGGTLLVGDVPNASSRSRFLASASGKRFHEQHYGTEAPRPGSGPGAEKEIDDGVVLGILERYRGRGFHAYVLPQDEALPMANRREDILIRRP